MNREEFIEWLDTIIDKSNVDWEIRHEFDDGTVMVAFMGVNLEDEEDAA